LLKLKTMGSINIPDSPNPAPDYMHEAVFANPLNLDANDSNAFYCEITGDTTLNLLNTRVGATYLIQLDMDGTGGHTVTLGELFRGTTVGSSAINTTANAVNLISVVKGEGGYLIYTIINVNVLTTTTTTTTT